MQTSNMQSTLGELLVALPSRRRLLMCRDFRMLWLGEAVSLVGDQLHLVALTWLALELTGSAALLGSVLAVAMLARAGCMLLGGVIVDRLFPQRIMVVINGLRAMLGAALTALVVFDLLAVWHLYVFGALFGLLDAFFQPAFLAMPPFLVSSGELPMANALLQGTRRTCEMLGPLLGGMVLKMSGAGAAFGADAASFVAAASLFTMIRTHEQAVARTSRPARSQEVRMDVRRFMREMSDGLRYVAQDSMLCMLAAVVALVNLMVAGPLAVGLPTLARTRFAGDPLAFGLLLAAFGGGALAGTILAGLPRKTTHWQQWIGGAVGLFALCFLLISATTSAWVAALAVALAGGGAGFVLVMIFTSFQQRSLPELRGRLMSVLVFASLTSAALSNALAGLIAEQSAGLLFAGAGGLLLCVLGGVGLNGRVHMLD